MFKTACKNYVALIREQLYRLLHFKVFWVLNIIIAGVCLLEVGIYALTNSILRSLSDGEVVNYTAVNALFSGMFSMNTLGVFVLIFTAVFCCGEFSNHTIRGKLASGFSRTTVYFATLTINYLVTIVFMLTTTVALLAFGTPILGWDLSQGTIPNVLIVIFGDLPAVAFITMICFCVRSRGASIGINIAVFVGSSLLCTIFVLFIDYSPIFEWLVRVLFVCLNTYLSSYGLDNSLVTLSYPILTMVLNYLISTAIFIVCGWAAFLKAEVK